MSKNDTVCIIGSSTNVMDNKKGYLIDEFDIIVRFNRAPTTGYEQYVGSKTTHRFVNTHVSRNAPYQDQDLMFLPSLKNQTILSFNKKSNSEFYRVFHETCDYERFDRDSIVKTFINNNSSVIDTSKLEKLHYGRGLEITVGLTAILYYINKGFTPTIYGFHLHDLTSEKSPHYFKTNKRPGVSHKNIDERIFILDLINKGLIDIL